MVSTQYQVWGVQPDLKAGFKGGICSLSPGQRRFHVVGR